MENNEKIISPIKEFADLRGVDLSYEDLSSIDIDTLLKCDFDTKTIWPESNKLPNGFNPEVVIEEAKNPGLNIRELHEQGVDGRGVTVAIIDQALSSSRDNFDACEEYTQNIIDYKEICLPDDEDLSNHGPAVTSLFVGKTCGVAPGARLVYRAVPHTPDSVKIRNFNFYADALLDIIELNKTLLPGDRVRIVSCSIGYMEDRPEPGLNRWIETIKTAESEDIIISDVSDRAVVDYIGGGSSGDKADIECYKYALFLKETEGDDEIMNELIYHKDIDGILQRIRETQGERFKDKSDEEIKQRIEKVLSNGPRKTIVVPSDYRTMSSSSGPDEYVYNGKGGMSWSVPYLSGIFALVWQIRPDLKKEKIAEIINQTAKVNSKGIRVINPVGIVEEVKRLKL